MPIRFQMSSIKGQIRLEHLELFALEFGKIAESGFVYTLASTNINQSAPNLVNMYVTIRSRISVIMGLTLSQTRNFRLFQTERVCRRQFKFDENSRKFSKWVENTAGKGEVARYEQFLLFPQFFQKPYIADT